MSHKKTRSLLQEISQYAPTMSKEEFIESRAEHAISSVIFLLEVIETKFDEEEAKILEKRLISSIRTRDSKKFLRVIRKLKEGRE